MDKTENSSEAPVPTINDNTAKSETSNTNILVGPHIEWTKENEKIMVEWCDVAQCYKWLNARAHGRYAYMHAWFTIPAIVLSTISGTASFAQTSLPIAYQTYSPMAIGAINIFIGLIGSNIKSHNAKPKQQTTFKKINFDKQLKPKYNDSL
jgi:hypothetical protein